jgi:hypothetical protein
VTSAGPFSSTVDCYNIKIAVFWDVVPRNVVAMYERFLRKLLPPPSVWNTHFVSLKMVAAYSSETVVHVYETSCHYISGDYYFGINSYDY